MEVKSESNIQLGRKTQEFDKNLKDSPSSASPVIDGVPGLEPAYGCITASVERGGEGVRASSSGEDGDRARINST